MLKITASLITILFTTSLYAQSTIENSSNLELCIDFINSPLNQSNPTQVARVNELNRRNENCQQYVELAKARQQNIKPEKSFLEKLGDALSGSGANSNNRPITTNCTTFGNQVNCETR